MLENLIDLVAAQHIVYGEFFESEEFSQVSEQWIPIMNADSSEEPLKRFIDSLLSSSQYYQVFRGGIPHLVGAPTSDLLISYSQNRNQFVERHFYIKYGRYPSTLQLKQASRRMLDYWSNNHEPGYWELSSPSAAPTNEESFSGFRRMLYNLAVLLLMMPVSVRLILYMNLPKICLSPKPEHTSVIFQTMFTNSLYRPVALLYSLHRENVDASDKSVLQQANELKGLSINQVLERITSDSNYNRRFNIIFHEDSPEVAYLQQILVMILEVNALVWHFYG